MRDDNIGRAGSFVDVARAKFVDVGRIGVLQEHHVVAMDKLILVNEPQ